jgi:hypothetical protein
VRLGAQASVSHLERVSEGGGGESEGGALTRYINGNLLRLVLVRGRGWRWQCEGEGPEGGGDDREATTQ